MRKKILFLTLITVLLIGGSAFADFDFDYSIVYPEQDISNDFGSFQNFYDDWLEEKLDLLIQAYSSLSDFNYENYYVIVFMDQENIIDPWNPDKWAVRIYRLDEEEEEFEIRYSNYGSDYQISHASDMYIIDNFDGEIDYFSSNFDSQMGFDDDEFWIFSNDLKDRHEDMQYIGNDDWILLSSPTNEPNNQMVTDFVQIQINDFRDTYKVEYTSLEDGKQVVYMSVPNGTELNIDESYDSVYSTLFVWNIRNYENELVRILQNGYSGYILPTYDPEGEVIFENIEEGSLNITLYQTSDLGERNEYIKAYYNGVNTSTTSDEIVLDNNNDGYRVVPMEFEVQLEGSSATTYSDILIDVFKIKENGVRIDQMEDVNPANAHYDSSTDKWTFTFERTGNTGIYVENDSINWIYVKIDNLEKTLYKRIKIVMTEDSNEYVPIDTGDMWDPGYSYPGYMPSYDEDDPYQSHPDSSTDEFTLLDILSNPFAWAKQTIQNVYASYLSIIAIIFPPFLPYEVVNAILILIALKIALRVVSR